LKKVLIISYYWPPSGGISVLRSLKIAKYLRNFGWEPIVFVPQDADYPSYDKSNFKDIPEDLTILRGPIWEPFKLFRLLTGKKKGSNVINVLVANDTKRGLMHQFSVWIRSNFFIPDARKFWIKPSVKYLEEYLKTNKVDAIFSDGPPHTNTRIACLLKMKTGIPWLSDFQDPWTQVDYYKMLTLTSWGDRKHRKMEQEVFQNADAMTIVSNEWRKDLISIGAKNVSVVPWGFDPDDFVNLKKPDLEYFRITHSGLIGFDRDPEVLINVLSELCEEIPDFREKLKIRFVGEVEYSILASIESHGLKQNLEWLGNVSREESLNYISSSTILLLLLNQQSNASGRIPGKLFEYLSVKRPIICLGISSGDTANIIKDANAGKTFEYTDKVKLKSYLKETWEKYQNGELEKLDSTSSDKYSIIELTGKIASILDEISK
jgi:glycosyltransferase involved in cell wall biosynthesis